MIRRLDRVVPAPPGRPRVGGPDHPMRRVTRQVALEPDGWTPERRAKVAELFDGMAPTWDTEGNHEVMQLPLRDALARGGPLVGPCVEIGAGRGRGTEVLAPRFGPVLATDLSNGMLRLFREATAQRAQADAAALPVRDASVGTLVLVNAFLFPGEAARVLAPGGAVVWVNTLGDATPIHLPPADVVAALQGGAGGAWDAVTAEAGWGEWTVVRRER